METAGIGEIRDLRWLVDYSCAHGLWFERPEPKQLRLVGSSIYHELWELQDDDKFKRVR